MTRIKRLVSEGSWIVVGQIAVVTGSLVLVRVLTEHLDPAQYGQLALALTLGTLVGQVAFSGVMPGIMRYYTVAAERNEVQEYFAATIWMICYGSIVALGLSILVLLGLLYFDKPDLLVLTGLTILFSIVSNYNTTLSIIQNSARQRAVVAFHSSLDAWLKVTFAAILLTWANGSVEVVVVGYLAALFSVLGSQTIFFQKLIPGPTSGFFQKLILGATSGGDKPSPWTAQIWQYSKPFVFFNAFTWMQASSGWWALETLSTTHDVGRYTVLMQLGYTPIAIVSGLMTALIGPILFQRSGDTTEPARNANVHKIAWQVTTATLLSTLLACLLAFLLSDWVFRLLVATEYRSVSYLLPWMILAGGLFSAGQVLGLKLMSDMKIQALIWPKIGTSLIGVMLSFAGAYIAGLTGVVYGAVTFSLLQLVWMSWISWYPDDKIKHKLE